MRIAVALLVGFALAMLTSFGVVRIATTAGNDPVAKPLYNYGSR